MLTNESKTILDYLISAFPDYEASMMNFSVISENTGLPLSTIDSALQYLESLGYVRLRRYKNGGFVRDVTHQGMHYKEFEAAKTSAAQTNIFNAPVTGSAIGNSGTVAITNGMSYTEVMQIINSKTDISEEDKAEAKKVVDYIENITSIDAPLPKSFLSRFSDTLAKHSWLPSLVGNLLIRYFIG